MIFWRKKKKTEEQETPEKEIENLAEDLNEIEPGEVVQDDVQHEQLSPEQAEQEDALPEQEEPHELAAEVLEEPQIEEVLEEQSIEVEEETPQDTLEDVPEEQVEGEQDQPKEGNWFSRLSKGLSKSSSKITQNITDLITKTKLDQDTMDQLEEVLIEADLGPQTAMKVIEEFAKDRFGKDLTADEIKEALADNVSDILTPVAHPLEIKKPENGGPFVILVCGVNGAGKTTTIGKLAHQFHFEQGLKVAIAAGDTFRAAAVEQLQIWAERVNAGFIAKDTGADAAAVSYEAYEQAKEQGADVLMIDTAGRLQNKKNLMEELQKIIRVLQKQDDSVPHATLLVLDSTTGQNAFSQVETFKELVDVTGLIVTKLDGSAKGGVLVGLADQFGVPVHAIGVGEGVEDLRPFDAQNYARSLMGVTDA